MNDLTFDEIREQIDERIIALETERDTEARKLINLRRRIDPSRVDLKPFVHILDKIRAEQALLAALDGAVKEHELQQAAYQREAAARAPQDRIERDQRRIRIAAERAFCSWDTLDASAREKLVNELRDLTSSPDLTVRAQAHRWLLERRAA